MLNFGSIREKALSQKLSLMHLLLLAAFIAVSLAVYYITYELSQSHIAAIILSLLLFLGMCTVTLVYVDLSNKLEKRDANKKTILLFSHDDELAGQMRYLLPHQNTILEWVRTYDSAIEILNHTNSYAFIIDTDNKPKNTASLVEMCRSREHNLRRLPIVAIQNEATAENKYQLLLEGFDDCLSKPIKKREFDGFYERWINTNESPTVLNTAESNTNHISDEQTDNHTVDLTDQQTDQQTEDQTKAEKATPAADGQKIVDTKLALVQSHQSYALAKDMLSLLISMVADSQNDLLAFYANKQWDELGELTHKIKGGCYCCGVPSLQQAVETIDSALENKQYDHLEPQFKQLMTEIEKLIQWNEDFDINVIFEEV